MRCPQPAGNGQRRFLAAACLLVAVAAGACGRQWLRDTADIPAPFLAEYREVVADVERLTGRNWYYGWRGNLLVVYCLDRARSRGECFDWAGFVFGRLREAAAAAGFAMERVGYRTALSEHHAVLLFRPDGRHPLIADFLAGRRRGYVLDPWADGQARVYEFGEWVAGALVRRETVRLEYVR